MCDCKPFCETHGRDEIAVEPDGSEYCNECAADGWSGELCHPSHKSCDMLHPKANEWERQFMCAEHAAVAELIEAADELKDVCNRPSAARTRAESWRRLDRALARVRSS